VVLHFPVIVGFLILLAPRVEAVTRTEVFDMHLSTAVQFLTLNYPVEKFSALLPEECTTHRSSWFNCEFAYIVASLKHDSSVALSLVLHIPGIVGFFLSYWHHVLKQ